MPVAVARIADVNITAHQERPERPVDLSRFQRQTSRVLAIQASAGNQATASLLTADAVRLDPGTRSRMESLFGIDFSSVRIHTGTQVAELAEDAGARAITIGTNILFGRGQFRPHDSDGQRLLAHELAHVIQQTGGRQTSASDSQAEIAAHDAASMATAGQHPAAQPASPTTAQFDDAPVAKTESIKKVRRRLRGVTQAVKQPGKRASSGPAGPFQSIVINGVDYALPPPVDLSDALTRDPESLPGLPPAAVRALQGESAQTPKAESKSGLTVVFGGQEIELKSKPLSELMNRPPTPEAPRFELPRMEEVIVNTLALAPFDLTIFPLLGASHPGASEEVDEMRRQLRPFPYKTKEAEKLGSGLEAAYQAVGTLGFGLAESGEQAVTRVAPRLLEAESGAATEIEQGALDVARAEKGAGELGAPAIGATEAAEVAAAESVEPAEVALRAERLESAQQALKSESGYIKQQGAAGEASAIRSLGQRGENVTDLNTFTPKSKNFPLLDVATNRRLVSVKVKGVGGPLKGYNVSSYERDLGNLLDANKAKRAAEELLNNKGTLQSTGSWPQTLGDHPSLERVTKYIQESSELAVPSDHVGPVRDYVRDLAKLVPSRYGLAENATDAEIEQLVNRIKSIDISSEDIGSMQQKIRLGQ